MKLGLHLLICGLMTATVGCSAAVKRPQPEVRTFTIATRRLPPPPVYSRLRWVFPPEPLPAGTVKVSSTAINPIIEFSVKGTALDKSAAVLAAPFNYHFYCSSEIADQKLTLTMLGTLDEVAQSIETTVGIKVVVDHQHREIRFLPMRPVTPEFPEAVIHDQQVQEVLESKVTADEHQSTH